MALIFLSLQTKNNLIKTKKKDDPSGSRTLLRLHRALEYITEFLGKLEHLEDTNNIAKLSVLSLESSELSHQPLTDNMIQYNNKTAARPSWSSPCSVDLFEFHCKTLTWPGSQ